MIVVLDTGVLGFIIHPNANFQDARECGEWYLRLASQAHIFCIPEIIDYESRRKLLQINSPSINKLNELKETLEYLPLTTSVMHRAARLWADAKNAHYRTDSSPKALDVDVILAAQAISHSKEINRTVVVATTDVGDLSLLGLDAREWGDIPNRR